MIKDFAEKSIKNQMIAYGQPEPKKEDLEKFHLEFYQMKKKLKE